MENGGLLDDFIKEFKSIDINVSFEDENKNIQEDNINDINIFEIKDIFKQKIGNVENYITDASKLNNNFINKNISELTKSNIRIGENNCINKESVDFNIEKFNKLNLNENVDLYIDKLSDKEIHCRLKRFNLQRYQGKKKNQAKLYYKCINLRKDEHLRQNNLK